MAKKRKIRTRITDRQKLFVEYLPQYNWNYAKAAIAAGYSKAYATSELTTVVKSNPSLCKMIDNKRREISGQTTDIFEKRLQQIRRRIDLLPEKDNNTFVKLVDQEAKLCGWHQQTITLESKNRQYVLDKAQMAEAQWLADVKYKVLPPAKVVEAEQKDELIVPGEENQVEQVE